MWHSEDAINKKNSSHHFSIVFQTSKMNLCGEEMQNILKFYYKNVKNETNAVNKICAVYGPNAVSMRVAQV